MFLAHVPGPQSAACASPPRRPHAKDEGDEAPTCELKVITDRLVCGGHGPHMQASVLTELAIRFCRSWECCAVGSGNDDDDLIPLKEFARRLAATSRPPGGLRDIALERFAGLYFKPADLARLLEAEQRSDNHDYIMTRSFLARTLGVDPRTVDKRLAHCPSRLVKGQHRYRQRDVAPMIQAARDELWQLHLMSEYLPGARSAGRRQTEPPVNANGASIRLGARYGLSRIRS